MTIAKTLAPFLRYFVSTVVVAVFMFPIFWWALSSIKPMSVWFNINEVIWFDFTPTFDNYRTTVLGQFGKFELFDGRAAIASSAIIAIASTFLTTFTALFAAYALSRLIKRGVHRVQYWLILLRCLPPIVIVIPLVLLYRDLGLVDTHLGLIIAHSVIALPVAILLLKSFIDDVPIEIEDAAMIDGASRFQCFGLVLLPMIKGGVAATAVLCFIFSWTEFLLAVFLTNSIKTIPVKISVMPGWGITGFTTALGTSALIPAFIFILLMQKHLVRGLTMGAVKN
ncbi:MAG: carbohydrate ABC transporter permease [Rhizobiales bacterium]|nr:carbohydrate ABC transporter permease [Hyphomicrobiales bacterium]